MTDKKHDSEPNKAEATSTTPESTIETEQTSKPQSPSPKPASQSKPSPASRSSAKEKQPSNKVAWVALIVAIITAGGGYWYMQQQNQQLAQQLAAMQSKLSASTQQVNSSIESTSKAIAADTTEVVSRVEVTQTQQQQSIEALQVAISDVKGRRPNDWLLAEADYLVNLASRKLNLEHDVVSATRLMESADQRIAALHDPSLTELRQAINDDLTELRSTPIYDKDGLVLRLISLQKAIDTLPLANAVVPEAAEQAPKQVSEDISDWQDNLKASLQAFSDQFITYRVRDGSAVPLLSPQQHFYLRENAKAKLETAIRGIYNEQDKMYSTSLETVVEWSKIYFAQDDAKVQKFNQELAELLKQDISIEYPSALTTQPVLEEVIRTRLRKEVTTLGNKEAL